MRSHNISSHNCDHLLKCLSQLQKKTNTLSVCDSHLSARGKEVLDQYTVYLCRSIALSSSAVLRWLYVSRFVMPNSFSLRFTVRSLTPITVDISLTVNAFDTILYSRRLKLLLVYFITLTSTLSARQLLCKLSIFISII